MNAKYLTIAALALPLVAAPIARAGVDVMTFEGLQNEESIDNYYNGGFGGSGSGPGPNYGVTFTSDSLALIAGNFGGSGNFDGNLAPSPHTIAFFLSGAGDVMDVAGGFSTGFSFWYDSPFYTGSVTVWSGLDGTGTELLDLSLAIIPENPAATYGSYNAWAESGGAFAGVAESAIFSGVANQIGFDEITIGASSVPPVPDNGGIVISILGGLGLVCFGRLLRKKQPMGA